MYFLIVNPLRRRQWLILVAILLIAAALIQSPRLLVLVTTPQGLLVLILIGIAGFLGAKGIQEFAAVFLRNPGEPWYSRRGAIGYLMIIMPLINGLMVIADHIMSQFIPLPRTGTLQGRIFLFMAAELLWIVFLTAVPSANGRRHYPFAGKPHYPQSSPPPKPHQSDWPTDDIPF